MGVLGLAFSAGRRVLRQWPWHLIIPGFLGIAAFAYLVWGWDSTTRIAGGRWEQSRRLLEQYTGSDPARRARLERFESEYGTIAVTSKLAFDARAISQRLEVEPLLGDPTGPQPVELALAQLAATTHLRDAPEEMQRFLAENYSVLASLPDSEVRAEMVSVLRRVSESPADWRVASASLVGPLVWQVTRERAELWEYYARNHDWLQGPLVDAVGTVEAGLSGLSDEDVVILESDATDVLVQLLVAARRHEDLLRAFPAETEAERALVLLVLTSHGDLVSAATKTYGLPLGETIGVVYANQDYFELGSDSSILRQQTCERCAKMLREIYDKAKTVWSAAKVTPYAVQLYQDAPQYAEAVLQLGPDDEPNPAFLAQLYAFYGDLDVDSNGYSRSMAYVAEALARHGELAAFVLSEYRDNEDFKALLGDKSVGSRVIPFVASQEMARDPSILSQAVRDHRWVDKYVDANGELLQDTRWWEAFPGGGLAKVARNWYQGKPNTWSELGWASFDAVVIPVEIALMVASGGSSVAGSVAMRTGVHGARLSRLARVAGPWAKAQRGLRVAGRLGRIGRTGGRAAVVAGAVARAPRAIGVAAGGIYRASLGMFHGAGRMAASMTPRQARTLFRVVGIGIVATKAFLQWDVAGLAPSQIAESVGKLAGSAGRAVLTSTGEMLAHAVQEAIGASREGLGGTVRPYLLHAIVVAVLCLMTFVSYRSLKPRTVRAV